MQFVVNGWFLIIPFGDGVAVLRTSCWENVYYTSFCVKNDPSTCCWAEDYLGQERGKAKLFFKKKLFLGPWAVP